MCDTGGAANRFEAFTMMHMHHKMGSLTTAISFDKFRRGTDTVGRRAASGELT